MPYAIDVDGLGEITVPDDASDVDVLSNVLVNKYLSGQMSDNDAQLSMIEGLMEQSMNARRQRGLPPPEPAAPDRGYLGEAGAGLWAGMKYTVGSGLSGIERLAERWNLDPTGDEAGWLRQAGESLKKGADEIKASPDLPEWYFKTFNAFGSILGFAGAAGAAGVASIVAGPASGLAALGITGAFAGGTGADEAYERAIKGKATEQQIDEATTLGFGIGLTELIAPLRAIRGLKKIMGMEKAVPNRGLTATSTEEIRKRTIDGASADTLAKNIGVDPKPFRSFGKRVAATAGLEGSQEAVAAIAQNAVEKYLYNPDTPLVDSQAFEEGLYGGGAGAMLEGILGIYGVRKSRGFRKKVDEFMDSDQYNKINKAADDSIRTMDDPEATPEAKAAAEDTLRRADVMMETALRDNVFNSREVVDYLKDQKDENGNQLYTDEYLERAGRQGQLKELYVNHTLNPHTKYEADAGDTLFKTVNPETNEVYTVEEIEAIKETKSGRELIEEVRLRSRAAKSKESLAAQSKRILARNEFGISDRRLNNIRKLFPAAPDESVIKYVELIQNAGETKGIAKAKRELDKILRENPENGFKIFEAKLGKERTRKDRTETEKTETTPENEAEQTKGTAEDTSQIVLVEEKNKSWWERFHTLEGKKFADQIKRELGENPNWAALAREHFDSQTPDALSALRSSAVQDVDGNLHHNTLTFRNAGHTERQKAIRETYGQEAVNEYVREWSLLAEDYVVNATEDVKGKGIHKDAAVVAWQQFRKEAAKELGIDINSRIPSERSKINSLARTKQEAAQDALAAAEIGKNEPQPPATTGTGQPTSPIGQAIGDSIPEFTGDDVSTATPDLILELTEADSLAADKLFMSMYESYYTFMFPNLKPLKENIDFENADTVLGMLKQNDGNVEDLLEELMYHSKSQTDLVSTVFNGGQNRRTGQPFTPFIEAQNIRLMLEGNPEYQQYIAKHGPMGASNLQKTATFRTKNFMDLWIGNHNKNEETLEREVNKPDETVITEASRDYAVLADNTLMKTGIISDEDIRTMATAMTSMMQFINPDKTKFEEVVDEQGNIIYTATNPHANDVKQIRFIREFAPNSPEKKAWIREETKLLNEELAELNQSGRNIRRLRTAGEINANEAEIQLLDIEAQRADIALRKNSLADTTYIGQQREKLRLGEVQTGREERSERFLERGKEGVLDTVSTDEGVITIYVGLLEQTQTESTVLQEQEGLREVSEKVPGFEATRMFFQTSSHETWHLIREMIFNRSQLDFFNRTITPALAKQNGWESESYYREKWEEAWNERAQAENVDTTTPQMIQLKENFINDRLLDEAQAYIFSKWYTGDQLTGLDPQPRRLMDMLKQFLEAIKNTFRKMGILKTPEEVQNESAKDEAIQLKRVDAKRLKREYENIKSGKLAREASRLDYEAAVPFIVGQLPGNKFNQPDENFIPIEKAIDTAKSLKDKLMGSTSAIAIEADPKSGESVGEVIMQDLSNFAKIFAHVSSISEKSEAFKEFYNQVQNRVQYRNAIKMTADVLAEHVGKFGGIFKIERSEVKNVQDLTILADAVGVDPEFTNLEGDNPTATITFTGKNVDEISNLYGNLAEGKPRAGWVHAKQPLTIERYKYLNNNEESMMGEQRDFERFLKDTGISRDKMTVTKGVREVTIEDTVIDQETGKPIKIVGEMTVFGDDPTVYTVPEYTYTYTETNPQVAAAFAGTYYAGQHVGDEKYKAIVHNLLNTGSFKGIGEEIGIRTGRESTYQSIQADIRKFLEDLGQFGTYGPDAEGNIVLQTPLYTSGKGLNKVEYEKLQDFHAQMMQAEELVREGGIEGLAEIDMVPFALGNVNLTFKQATMLVEILDAVANEKRPGYFPHLRFGDKAIAVYRRTRKDDAGNIMLNKKTGEPLRGPMIRIESVESKMGRTFGNIPVVGDRLNRNLKEQQRQRARELEREFPAEEFEVTQFDMTLDNLRSNKHGKALMQSMGTLDTLAAIFQGHIYDNKGEKIGRKEGAVEENLEHFVDMVRERVAGTRAETLLKPREGYPGFITERNNDGDYFRSAFQRFVDSSSNIASSLMIEPEMLEALENLDKIYGQNSNYSKTARNLFDYINNPNNESTLLRGYAFHWFLGYNLSSAAINLTQTIQGTVPILSAITGVTRGTGGVLTAGKDTMKLWKHMMADTATPRLGKYGFEFYKTELITKENYEALGRTVEEIGKPVEILDQSRKPDWMKAPEHDGEFEFLAELFKSGVIQPIQNMDLGAGEISKLLKSKNTRFLADSSGIAFGTVENVNRITAALAFYRAAKQDRNKANFKAYARGTRFGEQNLDAMDPETFARTMGAMGVEKTQFFMGKENRPMFFQGPIMSVVTQFQSFMWQMVGLYADALTKSMGGRLGNFSAEDQVAIKSMARKQLGMMALTMFAFGGAMGLPFMENFKQLWRLITENFGDEVGQDFEQGTREVLGPILGYNATDMLLRGLPRGMGMDISRRASYGDVIPLRLLMGGDPTDYTGPAISRIIDTVQGVNTSYDRGDMIGTAAALFPIAMGNLIRASLGESQYGTFTARGQQLLPAGELGLGEKFIYSMGFTPATVARARARRGQENYYQYRAANGKEYYSSRMATALSGYMTDIQNGNLSSATDNMQKYYEDYLKVMQHDIDNAATPSKQYNINLKSIYKRALRAHDALSLTTGPRVRKSVRPEIQRYIMEGAVASEG